MGSPKYDTSEEACLKVLTELCETEEDPRVYFTPTAVARGIIAGRKLSAHLYNISRTLENLAGTGQVEKVTTTTEPKSSIRSKDTVQLQVGYRVRIKQLDPDKDLPEGGDYQMLPSRTIQKS